MGLEMSMVAIVSKEGVALEWAIATALFHPFFLLCTRCSCWSESTYVPQGWIGEEYGQSWTVAAVVSVFIPDRILNCLKWLSCSAQVLGFMVRHIVVLH